MNLYDKSQTKVPYGLACINFPQRCATQAQTTEPLVIYSEKCFFYIGTHWTYEILNMLLSQKAERVKSYKQSGMLEYISQSQFDELPSPRVLNTHSLFSQLPVDFVNRKCKIILIMRNPKDVAVSFFHHHTGITQYEYEGTWEAYLPRFMQGLGEFCLFICLFVCFF